MQANTITLPVDVLNNGTTVDELFTRHEETVNRTTYRGPAHTVASRNILQLYRTFPKRSGLYLGALKVATKFTQDVLVPNADGSGDIAVPIIVDVSYSLPVGVTAAQAKAARQRAIALTDMDTVLGPLNEFGDI